MDEEPAQSFVVTVSSLERQTDPNWVLVVVVRAMWRTALTAMLSVSGLRGSSRRVRMIDAPAGETASEMLERALRGDGKPRCVDLPRRRLGLCRRSRRWTRQSRTGHRGLCRRGHFGGRRAASITPALKPDFSPEFLLHSPYLRPSNSHWRRHCRPLTRAQRFDRNRTRVGPAGDRNRPAGRPRRPRSCVTAPLRASQRDPTMYCMFAPR